MSVQSRLDRYAEPSGVGLRRSQEVHDHRLALNLYLEAELQVVPIPVLPVAVPSIEKPLGKSFVIIRSKAARIQQDIRVCGSRVAGRILQDRLRQQARCTAPDQHGVISPGTKGLRRHPREHGVHDA